MDEVFNAIKKDAGLQELVKILSESQYATGQVSYKKHKSHIGQYTTFESRSHKIGGWANLVGYVVELGKYYKDHPEPKTRHKVTFTIEINDKGEVERLTEDDYRTRHFDINI